jgi:hypothetical protein
MNQTGINIAPEDKRTLNIIKVKKNLGSIAKVIHYLLIKNKEYRQRIQELSQ